MIKFLLNFRWLGYKYTKINIPKIEIDPYAFIHDYQTRTYLQYANIIEKEVIGHSIVTMLNEDPRVISMNGKMISRGSGAQSFEVKTLAMWFLWCANEYGLENAKQFLEEFLNTDEIPVINTLWILGIEVDEPIILRDGYIIQPLENMPNSGDKEHFLQSKSQHFHKRSPTPVCAITKICSVNKTWGQEPPKNNATILQYQEASQRLYDISLLLNALNNISCIPYYATSYVDSKVPLGPFGGSGGGSQIYDVLAHGRSKLPNTEANKINELMDKYLAFSDNEKVRIQRVLNRLSQSKRRIQIEDKILDLGIALEMLLLENNPNNSHIAQSFRSHGSWLLTTDEEDRVKKCKQLKNLYKYRSDVAHSGILCKGSQKKIEQIYKEFPEYLTIAEDICQKVIRDGIPDWDKLVIPSVKIPSH